MDLILSAINDILVVIFDLFLFTRLVSLKNDRRSERIIMYGGCTLICVVYFIAVYHFRVATSVATVTIMTIPSLILFWCLSNYKDCRFLLTFCFIDTITLIVAFLGRCMGVYWGKQGYAAAAGFLLLLAFAVWKKGRNYFKDYHQLLEVVDAGWRSMAVCTVLIYIALIFFAAYPYPLMERLEYIPVYTVFCVIVISCYVVLVMSVVKTRQIHEQNKELQKKQELYQLAYTDQLTGLQNRAAYVERIQRIISGQESDGLCCIMLDMNYLKEINDTKGHLEGDRALVCVADALRQVFAPGWNIVYRIGGDEFLVILAEQDRERVEALLQKLNCELKKRGEESGVPLSVAAGYSMLAPDHLSDIENAIDQADQKMYEMKSFMKQLTACGDGTDGI